LILFWGGAVLKFGTCCIYILAHVISSFAIYDGDSFALNTKNSKQIFPEKDLRGHSHDFHIHLHVCDRFIYPHYRSAYSAVGKYVDRSWKYLNHSQTHECGNWD
jgi:hypothetical protein